MSYDDMKREFRVSPSSTFNQHRLLYPPKIINIHNIHIHYIQKFIKIGGMGIFAMVSRRRVKHSVEFTLQQ